MALLQETLRGGATLPIEDAALTKIVDLEHEDFFAHSVPIAKLSDVLREGIISGDFAVRIKKSSYEHRWHFNSLNDRYVSVLNGHYQPFVEREDVLILIKRQTGFVDPTDLDGDVIDGEYFFRWRISPREFMGLALLQTRSLARRLVLVKAIANNVWSENPDHAVPIYNYKDRSLLWPQKEL